MFLSQRCLFNYSNFDVHTIKMKWPSWKFILIMPLQDNWSLNHFNNHLYKATFRSCMDKYSSIIDFVFLSTSSLESSFRVTTGAFSASLLLLDSLDWFREPVGVTRPATLLKNKKQAFIFRVQVPYFKEKRKICIMNIYYFKINKLVLIVQQKLLKIQLLLTIVC